jgi:hypothetical protein
MEDEVLNVRNGRRNLQSTGPEQLYRRISVPLFFLPDHGSTGFLLLLSFIVYISFHFPQYLSHFLTSLFTKFSTFPLHLPHRI